MFGLRRKTLLEVVTEELAVTELALARARTIAEDWAAQVTLYEARGQRLASERIILETRATLDRTT